MRHWDTCARLRRLTTTRARIAACLRDESGIALIMAIGIMMVLVIVVASVIGFTSAGTRNAKHSNASEKAYAWPKPESTTPQPFSMPHTLADRLPNPDGGRFLLARNCRQEMHPLTLLPPRTSSYQGGTVTWRGTYCRGFVTAECTASDYGLLWRYATGTVRNPTGPGAASVKRTVGAKVQVTLPTSTAASSGLWNWVYSGAPATAPCNTNNTNNTRIINSAVVRSPIYTRGSLRRGSFAVIVEPGTGQRERLRVGGKLDLGSNQNFVGCVTNAPSCGRMPQLTSDLSNAFICCSGCAIVVVQGG